MSRIGLEWLERKKKAVVLPVGGGASGVPWYGSN